jgi:hypothetical protein
MRTRRRLADTVRRLGIDVDADSPTFLTQRIGVQDRRPETRRTGQGDYLHASSLVGGDFCPRREWLARKYGVSVRESSWGAMRVVWALGRAAENHARGQLIESMPGNAYGNWMCLCGGLEFLGLYRRVRCGRCGQNATVYGEPQIFDEGWKVSGSPDFIWEHAGVKNVVEIKSIQKKDFVPLSAPITGHVHQVQLYAYLYHRAGHLVSPRQRIIYVCKDYIQGGVYKEFVVEQDYGNPAPWLRAVGADAQLATQKEFLPHRLLACDNPRTPCARRCPVVERCFSLLTDYNDYNDG